MPCPRISASGSSPRASARSARITTSAAAPSDSCEALPAVIVPWGVKAGGSIASCATEVPGRMPSCAAHLKSHTLGPTSRAAASRASRRTCGTYRHTGRSCWWSERFSEATPLRRFAEIPPGEQPARLDHHAGGHDQLVAVLGEHLDAGRVMGVVGVSRPDEGARIADDHSRGRESSSSSASTYCAPSRAKPYGYEERRVRRSR